MSNIKLSLYENVENYDLYLPSSLRENMFVKPHSDDVLDMFKFIFNINKDKYENLLKDFQSQKDMLFIGISNSCAVFILNGSKIIKNCNNTLQVYNKIPNSSSIKRIILTEELNDNNFYAIEPYRKKLKYKPNIISPFENSFQDHIAVYDIDNPTKFYYPK